MVIADGSRLKQWRPKTRTGCRTCRVRRIKCDETRPTCNKCSSSGRQCGGYEVPAPTTNARQVNLLPKQTKSPDDPVRIEIRQPELCDLPMKLGQSEMRAFHCFHSKVVQLLSIHFTSSVWKDTVLRRSHRDPMILHGLVAIGAMFQVRYGSAGDSSKLQVSTHAPKSDNEQLALRHYTKAMACLRSTITCGTWSDRESMTESAVIACLLFICFELLQDDPIQAISHMTQGLQIIDEYSNISDVLKVESPQSNSSIKNLHGAGNSAVTPLLSNIANVFNRLDHEYAMSIPHVPFSRQKGSFWAQPPKLDVPQAFYEIGEAKRFLDTLTTHVLAFRKELSDLARQHHGLKSDCLTDELRDFCTFNAKARHLPPTLHTRLEKVKQELLAAYDGWLSALEPLRTDMRLPTAILMEIQSFYPWLVLTTAQYRTETSCDQHMDKFRHILTLATYYSGGANRKAGAYAFSLDTGMLVSLAFIAIKCRDSAMRWKAVDLLKDARIQEGVWGGKWMSAFVRKIVTVEEQRARDLAGILSVGHDLSTDDVPEEARFSDVVFVMDAGHGRLVCARHIDEESDELEILEETFSADG